MMIPYPVTLIPLFLIFKEIGWVGTFKPLIVPNFLGTAFFIFLLRQFFLSIPLDLSDAARIDGASEFGIFSRIVLPLAGYGRHNADCHPLFLRTKTVYPGDYLDWHEGIATNAK